ncbi:TPA: dTDP-4-dehydrorhamnose 3,5-epimerase family protein, partial [Escherichia coli]|nr:dTDP-4-dehydrorhamnose 3,5-epimerase family protein [Escherichia coli]
MNIVKTKIPEVIIFEPKVFGDSRGFFLESYNKKIFDEAIGRSVEFVQDNHSE